MSVRARIKCIGQFDLASGLQTATITIEVDSAGASYMHVRPFKRRRVYTMSLSDVAAMVVRRIIHAELREKQLAKAKKKKLVAKRKP